MERIKSHDSQLRRSGFYLRMGDAAGWTEARFGSLLMVTSSDLATLSEREWLNSVVSDLISYDVHNSYCLPYRYLSFNL
jgi:hypothetical protein